MFNPLYNHKENGASMQEHWLPFTHLMAQLKMDLSHMEDDREYDYHVHRIKDEY
jgi:hypothetical protein